jgi:putative restriction endonuclease
VNLLEKSLLEKIGYENGFENSLFDTDDEVLLSSARHQVQIKITQQANRWSLKINSVVWQFDGLIQNFPEIILKNGIFYISNLDNLGKFLRKTVELAKTISTQEFEDYKTKVGQEQNDINSISGTEIETIVRRRIGQDIYRKAMLNYWGGACAVTGIDVPEVLRASHAKPWKDCENDNERLDVYNGFLLNANFDALFDRCLITFDDLGKIVISPHLTQTQCNLLNIHSEIQLRWVAKEHLTYLHFHRSLFEGITLIR